MKVSVSLFLLLFLCTTSPAEADSAASDVIEQFDAGNYSAVAQLLQKMKQEQPEEYRSLPYALLHAKSCSLLQDSSCALEIYSTLVSDRYLSRFVLLPLARIAAAQGNTESAIHYYQSYLRNPSYPDYVEVAHEAFSYCQAQNKPEQLRSTAQIVSGHSATRRFGQLYEAKAYRLMKQDLQARSLLLGLIRSSKRDEVTNLALNDLDVIDGGRLDEREQISRGKLAFRVASYDLARKYLEPVAGKDIEYSYYYARSLFFLNDTTGAGKVFQLAMNTWPDDPKTPLCIYQYANVCLRQRDYATAQQLLRKLSRYQSSRLQESIAHKLVQALQAQSRHEEALQLLEPYCNSGSRAERAQSLMLRGRIHFQLGRYQEAASDFDSVLSLRSSMNRREATLWKGVALARLNRGPEALAAFRSLQDGTDFYAVMALEKMVSLGDPTAPRSTISSRLQLCKMPDSVQRGKVIARFASGDALPALLYLHLYEEGAQLLPSVSADAWQIVGIDAKDRLQRYLAIAHLAMLGKDYPRSTYYSEIFLKNFTPKSSLLSLPENVLQVLFPLPYRDEIEKFARERNVDPLLVTAIMKQESKFKRMARSSAFARGLMQIVPGTATHLASSLGLSGFSLEQLYRPDVSINLGTKYIQNMMNQFGNGVEFIAAAYNGGEANVRRWLACSVKNEPLDFFSSIDMMETKSYVALVRTNYEFYKSIYRDNHRDSVSLH